MALKKIVKGGEAHQIGLTNPNEAEGPSAVTEYYTLAHSGKFVSILFC
jgi:hypothetical protein